MSGIFLIPHMTDCIEKLTDLVNEETEDEKIVERTLTYCTDLINSKLEEDYNEHLMYKSNNVNAYGHGPFNLHLEDFKIVIDKFNTLTDDLIMYDEENLFFVSSVLAFLVFSILYNYFAGDVEGQQYISLVFHTLTNLFSQLSDNVKDNIIDETIKLTNNSITKEWIDEQILNDS